MLTSPSARRLEANAGLCFQGMNLVGKGFRVDADEVRQLGYDPASLPNVIKPHGHARNMMQAGELGFVIDLFGLTAEQARVEHPALYQWLLDRVKPERDHNNRQSYRDKWWQFGEARGRLRTAWAGLPRLILTPETSKHRVFAFRELPFCPDHKLYAICSTDPLLLGVLSSNVHAVWALRAGGRLGVGNDPTWTNTTCFLTFPFPVDDAGSERSARIRDLAGQIDAHRKRRLVAHTGLTLTAMYNVLDQLRSGSPLDAKARETHDRGLVGVLKALHDELDAEVLAAYGWSDLVLPRDEGELLQRLVALNAERAAEESRGLVRWLRPAFQDPALRNQALAPPAASGTQTALQAATQAATQDEMDLGIDDDNAAGDDATASPSSKKGRQPGAAADPSAAAPARRPWPNTLPEQMRGVADALALAARPVSVEAIAAGFTGRGPWKRRLPQILEALEALGRARGVNGLWTAG